MIEFRLTKHAERYGVRENMLQDIVAMGTPRVGLDNPIAIAESLERSWTHRRPAIARTGSIKLPGEARLFPMVAADLPGGRLLIYPNGWVALFRPGEGYTIGRTI